MRCTDDLDRRDGARQGRVLVKLMVIMVSRELRKFARTHIAAIGLALETVDDRTNSERRA